MNTRGGGEERIQAQRELIGATWSVRLIILFLGLPSLGFAVVSGLFNASYASRLGHGQEQSIWVMASVLVTCFVTGLPLAIEILRTRVPHLAAAARALWLASIAFSFIAAIGYAAVTRGEATAEAASTLNQRTGLERAIARGEAALAELPRHRPVATVMADIRRAELVADVSCANPKSRYARQVCAPVLELRSELATAEDAKRIETQLAEVRAQFSTLAAVGASANPQTDVLFWLGGGVLSPDGWERVLTVFIAALIEISAALGLAITARSVVELLAAPMATPVTPPQTAPVDAPPPPIETVMPEAQEPSPPPASELEAGWQRWFQTCVTPTMGDRITPKDAYAHYEAWAELNKIGGVILYLTFCRRMSEAIPIIGGKLGRSDGRYYGDVALSMDGRDQ